MTGIILLLLLGADRGVRAWHSFPGHIYHSAMLKPLTVCLSPIIDLMKRRRSHAFCTEASPEEGLLNRIELKESMLNLSLREEPENKIWSDVWCC